MRLSEWRAAAPARPAVDAKVIAVVTPVLEALGAGADPHCWVAWGDDVSSRWQVLVPTMSGLVVVFVRVNLAGEGPRASAKLVRWGRVQVGELAIETQSGHRILSFSVENVILKGVDAEADRVASFALGLIGAIDGRLASVDAAFGLPAAKRRAAPAGRSPSATGGAKRIATTSTGAKAAAATGAGKAGSKPAKTEPSGSASGPASTRGPASPAAASRAPATRTSRRGG
jgi:hypothetical protein